MTNPRLWFAPPDEQEAFQEAALRRSLEYLLANSPFYKETLAGCVPSALRLADLSSLPFTSKADIQRRNEAFCCVPKSAIREYTATSGTLGRPVTVPLTEADLQRLAYNESQSFRCAGGRAEDVYQLLLTLDRQFMAGMAYYSGIRAIGAASVRTGPGLPAMQWEVAQRLRVTQLVAVPSFLLQLAQFAGGHGIDLNATGIGGAVCIGEGIRRPDFSLNVLGEALQKAWPSLKLHVTYAATELQTAFTECSAGQGGHHQPDLVIVEIVDPATGTALPDGTPGEVVITTLGIEGMPLLRYRTGDVAALHGGACPCGRTSKRLGPVVGRLQHMIKYRGTTLYPPAIFDLLNEAGFVQEYLVEVFTGELGTDELRLHLHTALSADDCTARLRPFLQSRLRVMPLLVFHSGHDMQAMRFPAGSRKMLRFVDNRDQG